jgi:hypothetical protein
MNLTKEKTKRRFKKVETGYHKSAKEILSSWVGGEMEKPMKVDDRIIFVPDVAVYKDGILDCIYEVVYKNPFTGYKYGMIQYYCFMNVCELTVFEISADYILAQTEKPDPIIPMECYVVNPFEYDEDKLIKALG